MGTSDDIDLAEYWACRKCRYEGTFPHSWCGTIGCNCDECYTPVLPQILQELQRRFGIVIP